MSLSTENIWTPLFIGAVLTEMLVDKIVIERHGHKRRARTRQPRRPSPTSRPPSCASWRKRKRDLL